jgi:hypothetical protein
VFHWTARHPELHIEVSSYWLEDTGVLIDPLVPEPEGRAWFAERTHRMPRSGATWWRPLFPTARDGVVDSVTRMAAA